MLLQLFHYCLYYVVYPFQLQQGLPDNPSQQPPASGGGEGGAGLGGLGLRQLGRRAVQVVHGAPGEENLI